MSKKYNCICGENFVLDIPDFPHFCCNLFIEQINTPGKLVIKN